MKKIMWKSVIAVLVLVPATTWTATAQEDAGFVSMFDGRTLDGWHAVPADSIPDWSVEDGMIVGQGSVDRLVYLVYDDVELTDFELEASYRFPATATAESRSTRSRTRAASGRSLATTRISATWASGPTFSARGTSTSSSAKSTPAFAERAW